MPIPFYDLHDRTAEELAAELVRLIPAHTPEWRNPRPGDPGRTLIDLFAWMGDKLLYRVNLLPERQRLLFLRLLDLGLKPAVPARGLLQLAHASPRDHVRAPLADRTLVNGPVVFETLGEATILPLTGAVYLKRKPSAVEAASVAAILPSLGSVYGGDPSTAYVTTPAFADGQGDPAGLDIAQATVDQSLWIALLAAEPPDDKADFRQAVLARNPGPIVLNVGLAPKQRVEISEMSATAVRPRPGQWIWQVPSKRVRAGGEPVYATLGPPVADTTAGFTRTGIVRLVLPDAGEIGLPENDPDVDVLAGVGERPPRIDDPDVAARLIGWLRLRPKQRAQTLALSWIGLNAVAIEQLQTWRNLVVGQANGAGDLQLPLPASSVDAASLVVEVQRDDGRFEAWQQVDELASAPRLAKVYKLDAEAGVLTFGDGVRGAVPPPGARVRAAVLRAGGGTAGNLAPGTLDAIGHPRLKASQPLATTGGEAAETLDQAEKRLPARLRHGDRAVTERDFRDLAFETPGVDLARVEVLPRFRPFQRLSGAPGTVSVLVVNRPQRIDPPNPRPDRTLLTAVYDHLDARRVMGTELFVIAPDYRPLSVSASVQVRPGHGPDRVLADVEAGLRAYLAPVAPGGREGGGWPLGAEVGDLELEVVIARVTGVAAVYGVNLFERSPTGGWSLIAKGARGQATLPLEPWMLPELADVVLGEDPSGPADVVDVGGMGGAEGDGVLRPIPVVPELC
ncbi:MAG: putative baseplate assembly protein [Geminicoccaceae bacterium]|nr:MAG: putative baseplate assembly protein [Geminicoccaceae bacterium]